MKGNTDDLDFDLSPGKIFDVVCKGDSINRFIGQRIGLH